MTAPVQEPTFAPGFGPDGSAPEQASQAADYFGFQQTHRFMFPDGTTFIEFSVLNEGQKKDFQDKTSSDMIVERRSGDARMTLKQGTQRHELIKAACVDWNLKRNGDFVQFTKVQLGDFLTLGDPRIVENLEKEIRKVNPWLLADMTLEDMEKEMNNLEEMIKTKKAEMAGEAS